MPFQLEFKPSTLKEWQKLDNTKKAEFKKELQKILEFPSI